MIDSNPRTVEGLRQQFSTGGAAALDAEQLNTALSGALPPSQENEVLGYDAVVRGDVGAAYSLLKLSEAAYLELGEVEAASAVALAASRTLEAHFPPYTSDTDLIADVARWLKVRLAILRPADHAVITESEPEEELFAEERVRLQRWRLRLRRSRMDAVELRIDALSAALGLDAVDEYWLLALTAFEANRALDESRRSWFNNDGFFPAKLVLWLLTDDVEMRELLLQRLDMRYPLLGFQLIHLNTPKSRPGTSLANHYIELDESVLAYLGGRSYWPPGLDPVITFREETTERAAHYFDNQRSRIDAVVDQPSEGAKFVAVCGATWETSRSLVRAWSTHHGRNLYVVSAHLLFHDITTFAEKLRVVLRESLLRDATLLIYGKRTWRDGQVGAEELLGQLVRLTRSYPRTVFLDAPTKGEELFRRFLRPMYEVRVLPPTLDEQATLWEAALQEHDVVPIPPDVLLRKVCDMALNVEDIFRATEVCANNARLSRRSPEEALIIEPENLRDAATSSLNQGLYAVADRVPTSLGWHDVILPDDVLAQLMELVTYSRYQREVFELWGFGRKVPYGRANSSLFTGPPGTGKTMVAGIIARELGMDLFRVDLSRVVDKYVGETEKNLGRVFDEATGSHAVLLFDEADSLFAKRTEVKSSNDRYSNLEVNYLLQRIETFDGITILTSNFADNIDDAFARRIKFTVEFTFPDAKEREKLWASMIPDDAEVIEPVDFHLLAETFELAGGAIKNAVLRAAFQAAEAGTPIDTTFLETAAIAEYRALGKLIRVDSDGRPVRKEKRPLKQTSRRYHG